MVISMVTAYSQNWNLVWSEDFGVVEDSVIRDFPDPTMSVPGHQFDECHPISDGWYGITNSPWWAYNRKAKCDIGSAAHFTGGADHTGNPNGGMLVVNVDKTGHGEAIYRQKMKFQVCGQRKYRFSIYAAAVSNSLSSIDLPVLSMRIVNQDGDVLAEQSTGKIPLWEFNNPNDGTHAHDKKEWNEYNLEFVAQEGDELELQVLNYCVKDYLGNDFALDDISLYRDDNYQLEVPKLTALDAMNGEDNMHCKAAVRYSVVNDVITPWLDIYENVYFLWQKSSDNGYTWENLEDVSGIEKTTIYQEGRGTGEYTYRVIVTGGPSDVEAEKEALYIGTYGGPSNGCVYYSISSPIAHNSKVYDCSFRPSLRKIWRENFGTIDSLKTRTLDVISQNYQPYVPGQQEHFDEGAYYTVTCAPDSTIYHLSADGETKVYPEQHKTLGVTGQENDAFLYVNVPVGDKVLLVDKRFSAPLCPCQTYIVSVNAKGLEMDNGVFVTLTAQDERGVSYMDISYKVTLDEWQRFDMPVSIYTDEPVHIRIYCEAKGNQPAKIALDDIQFVICSDEAPQAEVGIDGDVNKKYEGVFDCGDPTEVHTVHLYSEDWDVARLSYSHVWQASTDGINWTTLNAESKVIQYDNSVGGSIMYRAVLARTKAVAQQVATNGYPDDYCELYYITTPVTISCKGCQKPKFSPLGATENTICEGSLMQVVMEVTELSTSPVDQYLWFEKSPQETEWTPLPTPGVPNVLKVTSADSMQYLFYATSGDCVSDSIIYQLNVVPLVVLEPLKDTAMCEGGKFTLVPVVLNGAPTEFYVNSELATMPYVIEDVRHGEHISLTASDGYCTSRPVSMQIGVEDSIRYTEYPNPMVVCPNDEGSLALGVEGSYTSALWKRNGVALTDAELADLIPLTESATFELSAEGNLCPSVHYSFDVVKLDGVKLSFANASLWVCEGDQFTLNLNEQNVSGLIWEQMRKGETSFSEVSSVAGSSYTAEAKDTVFYRVRVPSDLACEDNYSDTAVVYVEKRTKVPVYVGPTTICYGEKVTFVKDLESEGSWTKNSQSLPWVNQEGQMVAEDAPTENVHYTFLAESVSCPQELASVDIAVERKAPLEDPSAFSVPSYVCEDDPVQLLALPVVTTFGLENWEWRKGSDILTTSSLSYEDVPTTTTQYEFVAKGKVCPDTSKTFTVEVRKRPTVTLAASESSVCEASDVTFTATSSDAKDLTWQKKEEGASDFTIIETGTATEQSWQQNASATYRVIANSLYECLSDTSDYVSVKVEKPTIVSPSDFDVPTLVCEGGEVTLTASPTLLLNGPFAWRRGTETLTTTERSYTDQLTSDAQYEFVVQGTACPDASLTFDVQVEKRPTVTLTASETFVCESSNVTFAATSSDAKDLTWQRKGEDDADFTTVETSTAATQTWPMEASASYRVIAQPLEVCEPTVSEPVTVEVERKTTITPSDFDVPTLVCEGGEVTLKASPTLLLNGPFAWRRGTETLTTTERSYTDQLTSDAQYEFVVQGTACPDASLTFDVQVEKRPTVTLTASETFVCESSNVTFAATSSDAKDLTWQRKGEDDADFTTVETSTAATQTWPMEASASYRVIAQPLEVCEPTVSEPVTVEVEPKIEFLFDNLPALVCENSQISVQPRLSRLNGEGDYPDGWSRLVWNKNGALFASASSANALVDEITEKTLYTLIATGKVCPNDTNEYEINIVPRLNVQLASSVDSICADESAELTITYGADLESAACPRIQVRREDEASYRELGTGDCVGEGVSLGQLDNSSYVRVVVHGETCPDAFSNELFIHVDQPNELQLLTPSVCQGATAQLKVEGVQHYTKIEWSSVDTTVEAGSVRLEVQPTTDTEYQVKVINGVCENEASGVVHVQPYPVILSCDELKYDQYQVKVESPSSASVYNYGAGDTTSNLLEHAVIGREYRVVVKDEVGCADTFVFKPTVDLTIPKYFIADQETWKVINLDMFEKSYYSIYDRYGKLLYQGVGVDEGWDGYYLGHPMPSTDYWYDIHIPEIYREYTGHFTLLRQK